MFQFALGAIATLMAAVSYTIYIRDIRRGTTKPHAFSWLIWASLTAIAFGAQVSDGGGAGTWVTGFSAVISFGIFGVAILTGERNITSSDWACLWGAIFAGILWAITDNPLLAVLLITVIDALGFIPTFRKSFHRPLEETMLAYALSGTKYALALAALANFSLITALYPASLVIMNALFVAMLIVRREQLKTSEVGANSVALKNSDVINRHLLAIRRRSLFSGDGKICHYVHRHVRKR